eukprot:6199105-Pleurochrysis_carterae.AAC.2
MPRASQGGGWWSAFVATLAAEAAAAGGGRGRVYPMRRMRAPISASFDPDRGALSSVMRSPQDDASSRPSSAAVIKHHDF